MLELANNSPWAAGVFPGWSPARRHQSTIVVKAGFDFTLDGTLAPSPAPPAIVAQDRFHGDPSRTSLAAANETVPFKQGGELLITGTAHPFTPCTAMEVRASLGRPDGERREKALRVSGARAWQRSLFGSLPSHAAPLEPTPLRYEYAYGGVDVHYRVLERRNPVGCGFIAGRRSLPNCPLPAIEYLDEYIQRPYKRARPAGFGPLAPSWSPRFELASGAEQVASAPDACPYPAEVSPLLFNAAPVDQRFEAPFTGGEVLELRGFFPGYAESVTLKLPAPTPVLSLYDAGRWTTLEARLDTLQVDTDSRRLELLWRAALVRPPTESRQGWVHVDAEAA